MSEGEVIREVFRMAAVEGMFCRASAARLNDLRIPCAYVRDDRLLLRGKRKQRTSGVWRPGRIRGHLAASPAITTEATWDKAQKTLQANFLFGKRSDRTNT